MASDQVRVSIGMPVYNEEKFLRGALDSLLAQDTRDLEIIVSDNASNDGTRQICLDYAARDARIHYSRNETNLGPSENFNRVFRLSTGKYFMWAAGHDLWAPTFVSRCVEVLETDPTVVLCYPRLECIDTNGHTLSVADSNLDTRNRTLLARFSLTIFDPGMAFMVYGVIRPGSLLQTRLWRKVRGPDRILLSELAILGSFAQIPETLFYARDKWGEIAGPNRTNWAKPYFERLYPAGEYRFGRFFPQAALAWGQLGAVIHAKLGVMASLTLMAFVVLGLLYKELPLIFRRPLRGLARRFLVAISSHSGGEHPS
jgi:glycosyltransferase involved in cell wall biosynthesis